MNMIEHKVRCRGQEHNTIAKLTSSVIASLVPFLIAMGAKPRDLRGSIIVDEETYFYLLKPNRAKWQAAPWLPHELHLYLGSLLWQ
jgi:hypothetical protein